MTEKIEGRLHQDLESASRRKVVKTIVAGITALASYNVMPCKWGTPVIDQIFLPAHAQTSGAVQTFFVDSPNDPIHWMGITVNSDGSAQITRVNQLRSRRWEATLATTPGSGEFILAASAPGCAPPLITPPVTVEILAISSTELTLRYYGTVTVVIPAAPLPPPPALTGSCGTPIE
jgi:hypothetical protein